MGHLFYIPFSPWRGYGRGGESKGKITRVLSLLLFFHSPSSFTGLLGRSGNPSAINWFHTHTHCTMIQFFKAAHNCILSASVPCVASLSCCHWRLIPTFRNWRCSTFGQRCEGQLRGPELTFTSSIYFYCSSIYGRCNSPLIVISPPCRVFWYLKFFFPLTHLFS